MYFNVIDLTDINNIRRVGNWRLLPDSRYFGKYYLYSEKSGDELIFSIYATEIFLYAVKGKSMGTINIKVDEINLEEISLKDENVVKDYDAVVSVATNLIKEPHIVHIKVKQPIIMINSIYGLVK